MKQTKKSKAFGLFSQGFLPSSPEVKELGLHSSNRYKYHGEWERLGKPSDTSSQVKVSTVSSIKPSGETIGAIDETKSRPSVKPAEETLTEEPPAEETPEEEEPTEELPGGKKKVIELWPEDIPEEQVRAAKRAEESVGGVSEVLPQKIKDGKVIEPEHKIATTVAEDGIKCTVLLSLQTLTLYAIAKSTQAQISENGEGELSMGDFLDTCAADFFRVRGKKLGLINSGGNK